MLSINQYSCQSSGTDKILGYQISHLRWDSRADFAVGLTLISIWSLRLYLLKSIFCSEFGVFYLVLIIVIGDKSLFNTFRGYVRFFLCFVDSCQKYPYFLAFVFLAGGLFYEFLILDDFKDGIGKVCIFFFLFCLYYRHQCWIIGVKI